ncbi:glycosyl transferase family 2 [Halonotius aquaticus]|uniref:Glycosyl transferase family 2 n=1 Tax=Halonotius aquaticus TaxID=2216978 RepID=A0A3A6PJ73_9EURY|nr:glycosyltransferase [Halonotius aquaticus]RJX42034.1 glycosyl transferase family 2 [Halonotius aquaticus]
MALRTELTTGAWLCLSVVIVVPVLLLLLCLSRLSNNRPAVARDETWIPTVSLVIPTYNEAAIIEDRLTNLLETTYPAAQLEIVLADDSTDDTAVRARAFFHRRETAATLRVVDTGDRGGVAAALNEAIPASSGEVIFRTDADARLAPDAIPKAVAVLADPSVSGVTGRQTDVIGGSIVESDYRDLLAMLQSFETRLDSTFLVHGPCFAFRRAEFEPLSVDTIADDTAIAVQLRRNGGRIVMDPAIEFAECGSSSLSGRRTRKDRRAVGLLQQLLRHRDALGNYGRYGWLVLPLNWGLMIVGPWMVAATAAVGTLFGLVAAGPAGLLVPLLGGLFLIAGSKELLGPLQPLHAVVDAYLSLLIASLRLVWGDVDVAWEIDDAMREGL